MHQGLHAPFERNSLFVATVAKLLVDVLRQLQEHPDEQCHVTAGVIDVRLQKNAVAGGLVELDVVSLRQDPLKLRTVKSGMTAHERETRRIEKEFIVSDAFGGVEPGRSGGKEVLEAARPELFWYQLVITEHLEVLGDDGVGIDLTADFQGDLNRIRDESVALKLHLSPGHIETGDELLVGAGRSMSEDRLVELFLDGVIVYVLH